MLVFDFVQHNRIMDTFEFVVFILWLTFYTILVFDLFDTAGLIVFWLTSIVLQILLDQEEQALR